MSTTVFRSAVPSFLVDSATSSSPSGQSRMTDIDKTLESILSGAEQVVSYAGTSQYTLSRHGGGVSACGLAALNCARIVLGKERAGVKDVHLIREMLKLETMQEILGICLQWSSSLHLDVDDIYGVPLFEKTLKLLSREYALSDFPHFETLLTHLKRSSDQSSAAVVITRPPEIVVCLKIVTADKDIFVIFDSHPRHSKHPDGAAFIFNTSLEATATYLSQLLQYDPRLLADTAMQWQAQLLANYSGHMFMAKDMPADWMDAVVESSLRVLSLSGDVENLNVQNRSFQSENIRLYEEVNRLQSEVESLKQERWRSQQKSRDPGSGKRNQSHRSNGGSLADRAWMSTRQGTSSSGRQENFKYSMPKSVREDRNVMLASRLQLEEQELGHHSSGSNYAELKQREYEEEDFLLRMQLEQLKATAQETFDCGICLEQHPKDNVAAVESCNHLFCRECIRGYVCSKLEEGCFPIFCPTCMAEQNGHEYGVITNTMVQQVGISEKDFETFTETEMAVFSIILHCRKCKESVFVDKQEYNETNIIVCPLPACQHTWCKLCSHTVEVGGPKHSCDGSSELHHLMKQRGWKKCPGCSTPAEKTEGCHHMTCPAPGCNTHFCYQCGELIVRSMRRDDIKRQVSTHYRQCRLFDY